MERENEHEQHNQQQEDEDTLTIEEVAEDLQISTQKLRGEYQKYGWLKPIKLSKQTLRYTREALEKFKDRYTVNKKDEEKDT